VMVAQLSSSFEHNHQLRTGQLLEIRTLFHSCYPCRDPMSLANETHSI
jgi:hypothetical protein